VPAWTSRGNCLSRVIFPSVPPFLSKFFVVRGGFFFLEQGRVCPEGSVFFFGGPGSLENVISGKRALGYFAPGF